MQKFKSKWDMSVVYICCNASLCYLSNCFVVAMISQLLSWSITRGYGAKQRI